MKPTPTVLFLSAIGMLAIASFTYLALNVTPFMMSGGEAAVISTAGTSTVSWKRITGTKDINYIGGKVGIGTAPTSELDVLGTVKATSFVMNGLGMTDVIIGSLKEKGIEITDGALKVLGKEVEKPNVGWGSTGTTKVLQSSTTLGGVQLGTDGTTLTINGNLAVTGSMSASGNSASSCTNEVISTSPNKFICPDGKFLTGYDYTTSPYTWRCCRL